MKKILISICLFIFLIPIHGFCAQKSYDGLWFMGFNTNKDIFGDKNGKLVRQAFNFAINRSYICKKIVGDSNVPTGVIPVGMAGFDPLIKGYPYDPKIAIALLKQAGYSHRDQRLNNIVLLHTDGEMTVKIARFIRNDLSDIGVNIILKEIDYDDQDRWDAELSGGKNHMFLMGYKAMKFTESSSREESDTSDLLRPLFQSNGDANFTFIQNAQIDGLLDRTDALDASLSAERIKNFKEIARLLQENPVTVNLFYITKL